MNRFDDLFDEADAAFNATYQEELNQLKGLSPEDIASITPNIKEYTALVSVVEKASKENISKAQLAANIRQLGTVVVKIAKKTPLLSELFQS
jgi:transcriptional regulator|tara:strand:+ start:791 stop:1066 length:276 start_codon:yes stop_codon:yes gene_type:complete